MRVDEYKNTSMTEKISCVIHTHNSEALLAEVLKSVAWCDEIVVVDMESSDRSVEIANANEAKVVFHKNLGYADPARGFGLSHCTHNWVLAIDSDEIVPVALAKRLMAVAGSDEADVVELGFKHYFFGREIAGTGWSYRDIRVKRFFKKGFLTYGHEVHNFIQVSPQARQLSLIEEPLAICHFAYNSVEHFISKLNRYTTFEADKSMYDGNPWWMMFYQFHRELIGRFFIKHGYRDGWVGLYLSLAMAFYRITAVAKRRLPKEAAVVASYKKIASLVEVAPPKR